MSRRSAIILSSVVSASLVVASLALVPPGATRAAVVTLPAVQAQDAGYPDGYREWTHVKSMLIEEGHPLFETFGGIHHVYANDEALRTLKASLNGPYPDGATLVFDLLDVEEADATIVEAERKLTGVMRKSSARFPETGGWGFAAFGGDTRTALDIDVAQCFACHQAKAKADYVFTEWRK